PRTVLYCPRSSGTLCVPAPDPGPCVPRPRKGRVMNSRLNDPFGARAALDTPLDSFQVYRLDRLEKTLGVSLARLPFSIKVLLEAALRPCDGYQVTEDDVRRIAGWSPAPGAVAHEIPFKPARVILQDFTGVPCVVDLAAMRDAVSRLGGDARRINPLVPVD